MEYIKIIETIFLGVLQGATEFLPVSSSGHLVLAEYFMDVKGAGIAFDVFLHLGTLLAVFIYFWKDWLRILRSLGSPSFKDPDFRLLVLLVIATVPGALAGAALEGWVEHALRTPWVVVFTLFLVAIVLLYADRSSTKKKVIHGLSLRDAVVIGISQALAVIPGVSRSGITMSAGLFLGLSREESAHFSFLLSCPIILGAGLFEGVKMYNSSGLALSSTYYIGLFTSFFSGILVISFLLNFLRRHTFVPFVIYRVILAMVVAFTLLGSAHGQDYNAEGISAMIERLGEGVVNITSKPLGDDYMLLPSGEKGMQSGFILDGQGHVVTDAASILDPHSLEVVLYDGQRWPARLLGKDPDSQIAVLKIEAPEPVISGLRPIALAGDFKARTGEVLYVLGNPIGLGTACSRATVFFPSRSIRTSQGLIVDRVIELDRPLPPCLFGGPLVDLSGRGVGMISGAFTDHDFGKGVVYIGYALPVRLILRVAKAIITHGRVVHAWIGVTAKTITPQLASILRLPVKNGIIIVEIRPGSPAAKVGLKGSKKKVRIGNQTYWVGGDIVLAIDGKSIKGVDDFIERLEEKGPGKRVRLTVLRGRRKRYISLYPGKRPCGGR